MELQNAIYFQFQFNYVGPVSSPFLFDLRIQSLRYDSANWVTGSMLVWLGSVFVSSISICVLFHR